MWASGTKVAATVSKEMVNRGNLAAVDYSIGSGITCDDTGRVLDVSAIVPDGADHVLLHIVIKSASLGHLFEIRSNDHAADQNRIKIINTVINQEHYRTEWVGCSTDRKFKYYGSASITICNINICAWHT